MKYQILVVVSFVLSYFCISPSIFYFNIYIYMQTKICTAKHSNNHATQGCQTAKFLLISSGMGCIILPLPNRKYLSPHFTEWIFLFWFQYCFHVVKYMWNLKIDFFWQNLSKCSQIPPEWGSKNTPLRSHSSSNNA